MEALKVIIIGGTSHAGKSTLAQLLNNSLGWDYIATDYLARHPGRPWKTAQNPVPSHVSDHYRSLSADALVADVLRHYQTVWPTVSELVHQYAASSTAHLILEGSAAWPEWAAPLESDGVASVWLTASPAFLQQRIEEESRYAEATAPEKELIEKFKERTLRYNQKMMEVVNRLGLASIDVEKVSTADALSAECLRLLSR